MGQGPSATTRSKRVAASLVQSGYYSFTTFEMTVRSPVT
jgi:hypothetical protein